MKNILEVNRDDFMAKGISHIKNSRTLLDIGCGIIPHDYAHHDIYIACEPYEEYVDILKRDRINLSKPVYLDCCFLILNESWQSYLDIYGDYSVDTVYLIDVIEHLPKSDGIELLKRTEHIANKQIVIFTPLDPIVQEALPGNKDAWGLNGVDWQEHKSVWNPNDFQGDEWDFVVCKDFHQTNNIGRKLEKPVGAFWAIKNVKNCAKKNNLLTNQNILDQYTYWLKKGYEYKAKLVSDISAMKNKIDEKQSIINNLQAELLDIKNSRGYKLLENIWLLKQKLKRLLG